MNRSKPYFISLFLVACFGSCGVAGWLWWQSGVIANPWAGALLACAAPAGFFSLVLRARWARTRPHLWLMLGLAAAGTILAALLGGGAALALALVIGLGGSLSYVFWYSPLDRRAATRLGDGLPLPAFDLQSLDGEQISAASLMDRPVVWLFFRGNWCPFCIAQVDELFRDAEPLRALGARLVLISPQNAEHSSKLAAKYSPTLTFYQDPGNRAARALEICDEHALPAGMELLGYPHAAPMPTLLLTDRNGILRHVDLSENYRVRPKPEALIKALQRCAE